MLTYTCPVCGQAHTAPEHSAGAKRACTQCGQLLEVPPAPYWSAIPPTTLYPSLSKTRLGEPVLEVVPAGKRRWWPLRLFWKPAPVGRHESAREKNRRQWRNIVVLGVSIVGVFACLVFLLVLAVSLFDLDIFRRQGWF